MRKKWRSSFWYRLIIQFIFGVVIPIFCSWIIFEEVLKVYYTKNTLEVQYNNLQNCISLLEKSIETAMNSPEPLKESSDITYYLDYNPGKSLMSYSTFLRIKSMEEELCQTVPYLEKVTLYCDSPLVLYASPFKNLEKNTLEEEIIDLLDQTGVGETVWKVAFPDAQGFPAIHGYQKIYSSNYLNYIGYLEIQLSSELLGDCLLMMADFIQDSDGILTFYQGDTLIYNMSPDGNAKVAERPDRESGWKLEYFGNRYSHTLQIRDLDLCVVVTGSVTGLQESFNMMSPSLVISIIIVTLLLLFIVFFMNIRSLSKRILNFAEFMGKSDSNNLHPYEEDKHIGESKDELDFLINAYNTLIRENNTLISRIEKIELFTQAAKLRTLQNQIHPHFIYGTLETIRFMILMEQNDEAADMIYSFSELLRYTVGFDEKPVTLQKELEIASHYMAIQKIRLGDRLTYHVQADENLLNMKLPALILQPILENAVFYGCSKTGQLCEVNVTVTEDENNIVIKISNTGLLISPERLQEVNRLLNNEENQQEFQGHHNGKALLNINERLQIFWEGKASMMLIREEGRTVNSITIEKKICYNHSGQEGEVDV